MNTDERLLQILRDVLEDQELTVSDDTTAEDIEDWDSLVHVTLMFVIEQEFGIQFSGEEFARLENVGSLTRLIETKLGVPG